MNANSPFLKEESCNDSFLLELYIHSGKYKNIDIENDVLHSKASKGFFLRTMDILQQILPWVKPVNTPSTGFVTVSTQTLMGTVWNSAKPNQFLNWDVMFNWGEELNLNFQRHFVQTMLHIYLGSKIDIPCHFKYVKKNKYLIIL